MVTWHFYFSRTSCCNEKSDSCTRVGYSRELWTGVCRQSSWTLTLFSTEKTKTDTLFEAQTQKMTPYSRRKQNYYGFFCEITAAE